jgi:hypothetical protein
VTGMTGTPYIRVQGRIGAEQIGKAVDFILFPAQVKMGFKIIHLQFRNLIRKLVGGNDHFFLLRSPGGFQTASDFAPRGTGQCMKQERGIRLIGG